MLAPPADVAEAHVALRLRKLFRRVEDRARELAVVEEQHRLMPTMQSAMRINNVECQLNRLREKTEMEIANWRAAVEAKA